VPRAHLRSGLEASAHLPSEQSAAAADSYLDELFSSFESSGSPERLKERLSYPTAGEAPDISSPLTSF
jgi:hypothetical protein